MQLATLSKRIGLTARTRKSVPFVLKGVSLTDPGCRRSNNEDAIALTLADPPTRQQSNLAILADGMGGHAAGEIASQLTVETISKVFSNSLISSASDLHKVCQRANANVWKMSQENAQYVGMGTTCTALAVHHQKMFFVHVGDSRLYQQRKGELQQLSEDHTLQSELMKSKREEAMQVNPNILSRALGIQPTVEFQVVPSVKVSIGDRFLLCSDGLHDLVDDDELGDLLSIPDINLAVESMLSLARYRGGHDNISLIILVATSI